MAATAILQRATPNGRDSKAPTADSHGSSASPASQATPHHSGQDMSHHHKSHKDSKDSSGKKKKKKKKEEEEEEEGHEPYQEELQPQGVQGWWPPLG